MGALEKNSAQAKSVPYLQAGKGKKGAADFLASLAAVEMRDFKVGGLLACGNKSVLRSSSNSR